MGDSSTSWSTWILGWIYSDGTSPQDRAYDGPNGFRCLRYEVEQWRERRWRLFPEYLASQCKSEACLLSILVPSMHDTAEVIEIPIETAPLARMVTLSWCHVQQISLYGKYNELSQSTDHLWYVRAMSTFNHGSAAL